MEAVILAGGQGTRLRPYTTTIPKPLVPVGDKAILEIVIRQLVLAGVTRVRLAVNHRAEIIMAFFGAGEKLGVPIVYSVEECALGTVGPLQLLADLPEHFLVMNGDLLTDLDYAALYRDHLAGGAPLTVATYSRDVKIDFGVLEVDAARRLVTGFHEKPVYHFDVSMGIYVFSRAILARIPVDRPYGFDELVLGCLKDGVPIRVYPHRGYWLDLGRPEDYDRANEEAGKLDFLRGV